MVFVNDVDTCNLGAFLALMEFCMIAITGASKLHQSRGKIRKRTVHLKLSNVPFFTGIQVALEDINAPALRT